MLQARENVCVCLDLDSLSFSYNSSDGYQRFNYIFVNIQFGMMVKTTHFISPQIELSLRNQLSETPLFLIIPHDDKIKLHATVCVGGWRYQIPLKLILLPIDSSHAEMKTVIISESHQRSFFDGV